MPRFPPGVLAAVASAVVLGACAAPRPATSVQRRAPAVIYDPVHYRFTVDEELSQLSAEVCFEGAPPPELICGERGGESDFRGAELLGDAGARPLPLVDGRIQLADVPPGGCVRYRVDLAQPGDRYGDAVITSVTNWLWRPSRNVRMARVTASVELPDGMAASLPWPERDGRYHLDATSFGFKSHAAFGRFERERVEVPGGEMDVAVLDGLPADTRRHVRPWLETSGRAAALATGRLARQRVQIIVIPSGPSDDPVGFGQMTRGGGASVILFLHGNARLGPLLRSWVAIHEFSHLLHPFVSRDDAWLSEGLATYYQEVLRVRAGLLDEREAWGRLLEGAQRGTQARYSLARESAEMYMTYNFPMVYWAGAAVALLTDVELRSRDADQSLDGVLAELSSCCGMAPRPWSAARVVARVDELAGHPAMGPIVAAHVEQRPLPQIESVLERLGVRVEEGGVSFDDEAELAHVRRAIMRIDPDEAKRTRALLAAE